jgi:hypothetical protein
MESTVGCDSGCGLISVRLSDGLGNRLFQLAALLGYAERWGKKPTLFPSQIHPCTHADSMKAHRLFPELNITWDVSGWTSVGESAEDYASYKPFSKPTSDVEPILLKGFFQTEKYFPSQGIKLSFESVLGEHRMSDLRQHYRSYVWWIHLRLGDYMTLSHYDIDLPAYLRAVLPRIPAGTRVILYSDSPGPALELVQRIAPRLSVVSASDLMPSNLTPLETLYCMSLGSSGCVCTNSTFSWWGAYCSKARIAGAPIYFPGRWNKLPYATADVYPSWGIRVDY